MKQQERYTIAEFAKLLDVSTTAIYKRLEKDLTKYLIIDGKKKYISHEYFTDNREQFETCFKQVSNEVSNSLELEKEEAGKNISISAFEALSAELKSKDEVINTLQKQIETLLEMAKEKDSFIMEQSKQLSMLLDNSQKLQAMITTQGLLTGEGTQTENTTDTPKEEKKKRKNIFSKMFSK